MSTIDQSRLLQMRSSILNQNQALQRATHSLARLWQRKRRPMRQVSLA